VDIVEGLAPYEMEDETTNNSLRVIDVGALTTLGTLGCTTQRKMMVIHLD
jgi:hypothetical protein